MLRVVDPRSRTFHGINESVNEATKGEAPDMVSMNYLGQIARQTNGPSTAETNS